MRRGAIALLIFLSACGSVRTPDQHCPACPLEVIVFLGPDCPVSQKYVPRLNDLAKRFSDSVRFTGYVPGERGQKLMDTFRVEYQVGIYLVADKRNRIARELGARVTPEAFVLKDGKIIYRGAIDNWFFALGKYRNETTEHYLRDAILSALQNKIPAVAATEAIGCFIEQ